MTRPAALHEAHALLVVGCLLATAPSCDAQAQPATRPLRLGAFFWHDSPNDVEALLGIRSAWKTTGIPHEFVVRQANSDTGRARDQLRELRDMKCDLVFALGTQAGQLAKDNLQDLPVVFTAVTNPVASGITRDWGPTGTKLAGNSNWIPPETVMHVFRLAVPELAKLGMLRSETAGVVSAAELAAMREYLAKPGAPRVEILERVVADANGIAAAVADLLRERVQAIWIPIDFTIYQNMPLVQKARGESHVPLIASSLQGAKNGATVGVLVDYSLLGKRAAALAIDILVHGKEPGSLPIGTLRGFQVIVNLEAARKAGYELPLSFLAIADILIDAPAKEVRK